MHKRFSKIIRKLKSKRVMNQSIEFLKMLTTVMHRTLELFNLRQDHEG